MNIQIKTILFTLLILMIGNKAYAQGDIAVKNADGVTIYYNYINDGKELEVTSGYYSGNIVIPDEVTYMNRTRKVTSIGERAFFQRSSLTSATIPNSVTSIGDYAFYECSSLTSVTIPNSVTSIGNYAFSCCSGLTSVTLGNSVTSIGVEAFYHCSNLTSVTIPNSVTSIGNGAFSNCSNLTSVTIPNSVTSIGDYVFSSCSSLTSATIPNSVTSIGDYAFYECSSLTSVTIPNSVTSIGNYAFAGADISTVISLITNPFNIRSNTFSKSTCLNSTLYVPKGTINKYKSTEGWKDFLFIEEGDGSTNGVASVRSYGVMIQASEGFFNISGLEVGTPISVYNTAGQMVGSAKAASETTIVNTTLRSGEIGIVKIGDKSVKVLMK